MMEEDSESNVYLWVKAFGFSLVSLVASPTIKNSKAPATYSFIHEKDVISNGLERIPLAIHQMDID